MNFSSEFEILLVALMTTFACVLSGFFLVLRKMTMSSDAIAHSVVLGIVVGFFYFQDLNSPFLIFCAGLSGLFMIYAVESLKATNLVNEDSALGIVFPAIFAVAIILVARYASGVHLDQDAVILGELVFAPFDRLNFFGVDLGPKAFYLMSGLVLINVVFLLLFFRQLKLSSFDPVFAASLGISPVLWNYALMTIVSFTTVGAFNAVGAVLVVALMVVPATTAYFIAESVGGMIFYSLLLAFVGSVGGFYLAVFFDLSIAGMIATFLGFIFILLFLFIPKKGLFSLWRARKQRQENLVLVTLLIHLKNHQNSLDRSVRCSLKELPKYFSREKSEISAFVKTACNRGFVRQIDDFLVPTSQGLDFLKKYS